MRPHSGDLGGEIAGFGGAELADRADARVMQRTLRGYAKVSIGGEDAANAAGEGTAVGGA